MYNSASGAMKILHSDFHMLLTAYIKYTKFWWFPKVNLSNSYKISNKTTMS